MNKKKLQRCLLRDIKQQAQDMLDNGCDRFDRLNDMQEAFDEDCERMKQKPHHRFISCAKNERIRCR